MATTIPHTFAALAKMPADETRAFSPAVYVTQSGQPGVDQRVHAVRTNGHYLIDASAPVVSVDEYPAVGETRYADGPVQGIIPDAAWTRGLPNAPKHGPEILSRAIVDTDHARATLASTDLDVPTVITTALVEGPYPDYQAVAPKGKPALRIGLSPEYVKALVTAMEACTGASARDRAVLVLELWNADKPVRLTMARATDDREVTALLMPVRL